MIRIFSTYPEDRAKLLGLARQCERSDDANAVELGDMVRAILEDEAVREPDAFLVEWKQGGLTWVHAHADEPTAVDQARAKGGECTPLYRGDAA
jgi:hypothetical protein